MRGFARISALVVTFTLSTAQAGPLPAEVYGRLPAVGGIAISPDGTKLNVEINQGDDSLLSVVGIDGTQIRAIRAGDAQRFRDVGWAQDDIATFVASETVGKGRFGSFARYMGNTPNLFEYFRAGTLTLADGKNRLMLNDLDIGFLQPTLSSILAPIENDPDFGRMIAFTFNGNSLVEGVMRVNLATGHGDIAKVVPGDTIDLLLDRRGREYARTEATGNGSWRLYAAAGNGFERLVRTESVFSGATPVLNGILQDGRLARLQLPSFGDLTVLAAIDPNTSKGQILFKDPAFDMADTISDPWTHEIVGVTWEGKMYEEQHFFDSQIEGIRQYLTTALGGIPHVLSWSADRSRFIVYDETQSDTGIYYLFKPENHALTRLARTYPELPVDQLGEILSITYPARDGTKIPAYLTVPPGGALKNLPLVVLVHGGPADRDTADFAHFTFWPQFLASRGYLVLQPQFRGSTGYGARWATAGNQQWNGLMQTDVDDGAAALAKAGYADGKHTCIVGASYGGYSALAAAAFTPDLYACAVSVAGVADVPLLFREEAQEYGEGSPQVEYWRAMIGDPATQMQHLQEISPAEHTSGVHIPILLLHGTHDTVVPIEQTRMMYNKLKAAHKDVQFTELPGDDHWLSHASTRTLMLEEIARFLAKYLPAAPGENAKTSELVKPKIPVSAFAGETFLERTGHEHLALPSVIHHEDDPLLKLPQ